MLEATLMENEILRDIRDKTGLTFRKLGGIDTRDKMIADAVLPVLARWVERLSDVPHRRGIYSRFNTPHAYPHLEEIIGWWTKEPDAIAAGFLTVSLASLIKRGGAERIWKLCQELPPHQFHFMLLSKLANCAAVERQVKDALVDALHTNTLRAGDLSYIAEVKDTRIRRWFAGQVLNADPNIRAVARRVVARGRALPKGVRYAESGPARSVELFSTEANLEDVKPLVKKIAGQFNLRLPAVVNSGMFLSAAEMNRWLVAELYTTDENLVSLWFRLEDVDAVEIVLTKKQLPVI